MIKVVTDSTAYIPQNLIAQYDIHVVSLLVNFGKETFREVDMDTGEFFNRLSLEPELPTTSSPPSVEFQNLFTRLVEAGHHVVCVTISSKLSGTYDSAQVALKDLPPEVGEKVALIDSMSADGGTALVAIATARLAEQGLAFEEVVRLAERVRDNTHTMLVPDTLEYLLKGGRIGAAAAFVGTLLKIKPVLIVIDGAIHPLAKVRTKRKAIERMVEEMENIVDGERPISVCVMDALNFDEADALADKIKSRFNCRSMIRHTVGAVIGTHVGPRGMGLAFYQEP